MSLNYNRDGLDVNSIRGLFPKDLHKWLMWIQKGNALYIDKEKVQNLIAQQRTNLADVSNLDLNSINSIIDNFENTSDKIEKNQKKLHITRPRQQINPIVREGKIKVRCSFIKTIRLITKIMTLTNNYKARIGEKEKKFVSTSFFPFPLQVITSCTYC